MKKLACFVVVLVLSLSVVMTAFAYDEKDISYSKSAPFFEYNQGSSTYTSIHSWTVANIKHIFRAYSTANNSVFTGAQTMGTHVTKTSNAQSCEIRSTPNFSSSMANNGKSITVSYSGGSYQVNYYADFYYNENGSRITMRDTLHNIVTSFTGSKTLTK